MRGLPFPWIGPAVRRLAVAIRSLEQTGIPGPEIRDFIPKRLSVS